MAEVGNQVFPSPYVFSGIAKNEDYWAGNNGGDGDDTNDATSSTSSIGSSSSMSDMADDACSSLDSHNSSSSSSSSAGPLSDLSDLMTQLPIKRGLSKFYNGKSQSYTCLARVTSVEDLPKKETPYRRKMNSSKSYAGGLDTYKLYTHPKPAISKKPSRGSTLTLSSSSLGGRRGSLLSICRHPLITVQENLGC
ncbi:hypothetical protein NMG60_11005089 [Bertholletia excelsa]